MSRAICFGRFCRFRKKTPYHYGTIILTGFVQQMLISHLVIIALFHRRSLQSILEDRPPLLLGDNNFLDVSRQVSVLPVARQEIMLLFQSKETQRRQ